MTQSNFIFLEKEFPIFYNLGCSAEYNLYTDPSTTLWKLRVFVEKLVDYLFKVHGLDGSSDSNLHNRIRTLEDEKVIYTNVTALIHSVRQMGNKAAHGGGSFAEAKIVLETTFKLSKWFYQTYSSQNRDIATVKFNTPPNLDARHALHESEKKLLELEKKFNSLVKEKEDTKITETKAAKIRVRSESLANKIEINEAETRKLIDAQLRQAGWEADTENFNYRTKKTLPQKGKFIAIAEWPAGQERADYALFIGQKLYGIVEAKKWAQDISTDLRQSKIYASQITGEGGAETIGEWRKYKAPFLFSTNGRPYLPQIDTKSGIWFLDVRKKENNSRALQAWYSPQGLQSLFENDLSLANKDLKATQKDFLRDPKGLSLREYQIEAIDKIENFIINNKGQRKALLAMATGTGKTRTIIGLCYRLIKANRFKRILFLTDRRTLAIQAINDFKDKRVESLNSFPEIYHVEELKSVLPNVETRLQFATVQSMVKRLYYKDDEKGGQVPPIDTYDCIIVDEAHRGYLEDREMDDEELEFKDQRDYVSKYRMVLEYFDAFAIGLTATPALHTIEIFGKPVHNYSYREAVIDGFLRDHETPVKLRTELGEKGIIWKKGERPKVYDKENNRILELDELEDELKIEIDGFNKLVLTEKFNRTVLKQLVHYLDPDSDEKTLIFAANDEHADLIVKILKEEFAKISVEPGDDAITKITGKSYKVESLVIQYKNEKYPNIAVTVDLLTTGIDVPSICNLVFMRRVKSRILYEQMMGRATRPCDEIGKEVFRIYDAVRLYEALEDFTNMKPVVPNPKAKFSELAGEITAIKSEERLKQQIEQIIAKLQRKKKKIVGDAEEKIKYYSGGKDPQGYIDMLRDLTTSNSIEEIIKAAELWKYLDEFKPQPEYQLISDHEDMVLEPEIGFSGKKPEDYLDGFREYINQNLNRISALKLVCNKPAELNRKSLKELYMVLDQAGYTSINLRQAWKQVKKEEIAADIIAFIRTMALGDNLVSPEERIKRAMTKIKGLQSWNKVQEKWLNRFEAQLLKETILTADDIDKPPFKEDGGYKKLNKIFDNKLGTILNEINETLYQSAG